MGLFGKKKSTEEILAEGRVQYEKGDLKKAFLTLHGLAGKGEPQACYYLGRIYLERREKSLAQSFLTTAAKGGARDAGALLAQEFGIRDYLPKEAAPQPVPASASRPRADDAPSVDDLLEELEETGKLIQDTKRELRQAEKKMGRVEEISRSKPQAAAERPVPPTPSATAPTPEPQQAPEIRSVSCAPSVAVPAPVTQAVPAKNPVLSPAEKSEEELSPEEKYQKGMELFRAGKYEEAYTLLRAVCKPLYLKWNKDKNIYPAGQAALGWMCETGSGTKQDASSASMHYRNAIDNATGVPDKNGMAGFVRLTTRAEQPTLKACDMALDYVRQIGTAEAKAAVPALEKKLAEAQLREKYSGWELTEGNVQTIFNRCLAKADSKDFSYASLFPTTHGYEVDAEKQIQFDTVALVKNKRTIEYLFGQIQEAHRTKRPNDLTADDLNTTYLGNHWTDDKGTLLKFLYLGVSPETLCISPFMKKTATAIMAPAIKPTLSPKDPAFPAWWEAHKAEWED